MENLGLDEGDLGSIYQPLNKPDVRTSTAILNPNVAGISQDHLSWIWTAGQHQHVQKGNYLAECKRISFPHLAELVDTSI
jgi:hypothetical protein